MKSARNLSMECAKLVAACFVVFLHVPFPGELGGLVSCLSRFAVPMFFAISGYFSYQAEPWKLKKRLFHILQLEFLGIALYLLWRCIQAVMLDLSLLDTLISCIPTGTDLVKWFFLNVDPFSGPLWYLSAMAGCYACLWLYMQVCGNRLGSYRPLYFISALLLTVFFCLGEFSRLLGFQVDFVFYRNVWFFGLPMFTMGIFLRNHQTRLLSRFPHPERSLISLMALGILLSLMERKYLGGGEMPVGTVILTGALLLLLAAHPAPGAPKLLLCFGSLSTYLYLLHILIHDFYLTFFQWRLWQQYPNIEPWLRPLIVLGMSLVCAVAIVSVQALFKGLRKKAKIS